MENILVFNEELICDIFPDGEAVIYDDKNENTHILNETALLAFNACVGFTLQQAEENYLKNYNLSDKIVRLVDDLTESDGSENTYSQKKSTEEEIVSRDEILIDFRRIVEVFLENEILCFSEGPK